MTEAQLAMLAVDVIASSGGFAQRMSHRFLVGVPDLIIKLPASPAGWLEVKQSTRPKRSPCVAIDTTLSQRLFLQRAARANMPAGVLSFVWEKVRGRNIIWFTLIEPETLVVGLEEYKPWDVQIFLEELERWTTA